MAESCATESSPSVVADVAPCTVSLTHVGPAESSSSISHKYSVDLRKACAAFVAVDGDEEDDGKMKKEDMAKAVKSLGWSSTTDEEIDKLVSSLNVENDESGLVNVADFIEAFRKSSSVAAVAHVESGDCGAEEMVECFRMFDKDGDGKISLEELKQALSVIGVKAREDEVHELMAQADVNRDGAVCYEEFVKLLLAPM